MFLPEARLNSCWSAQRNVAAVHKRAKVGQAVCRSKDSAGTALLYMQFKASINLQAGASGLDPRHHRGLFHVQVVRLAAAALDRGRRLVACDQVRGEVEAAPRQ